MSPNLHKNSSKRGILTKTTVKVTGSFSEYDEQADTQNLRNKKALNVQQIKDINPETKEGGEQPQTNQHGRVINKRLIQQSRYNEVLRNHKAIPEAGTTEQQLRKHYDERVSEQQIQKLLNGPINTELNGGLKAFGGFKHSRNRLLNK